MTQSPLKVLFVLNSLNAGGAEKQVLSLLAHLDRALFDCALTYLRRQEQLLPQVPSHLTWARCCDSRSYLDVPAIRRLADHVNEYRPDLVVCTNTWSLMNLAVARMWTRHTFRTVEVFHTTGLHTLKQRLQMQLYRPLFEQCDSLVYVCENQRRYWRRQGLHARHDHVIHNGIDVRHFSWNRAQDVASIREQFGFAESDYVIGLCAGLRPEKAHGDLLQIVKELRGRDLPGKALLIGDGAQRAHIESVIRDLNLQAHVRITGFQADVRPFIAACDVMTLVSHSIETFSIAALEAMSLGKPMVMTNIGGADEQIRQNETGYLFEPGDIQAAVTHFARLADADVRARMGAVAAADVRARFSLERMVRAYEDHFLALCSRQRLHRAA